MAVALLQRNPIVMRPRSQIELEYSKYRQSLETERSRGTFNIGKTGGSGTGGVAVNELTVPEVIELNEQFDPKDLKRKLDRKLYLCVKNDSGNWTLPMSRFNLQEDLNDSGLHSKAHDLLADILRPSEGLQLYHLGVAPVAFHVEKYADRVTAPFGAKHFFFRSELVGGKVRLENDRFGWLAREEMAEKLPRELFESIKQIITE